MAYNEVHLKHASISAVHGHSSWHIKGGSQSNVSAMAYQDAAGMDNEQTRHTAGVVCWNPWQCRFSGRFAAPMCSTDED